MFLPTDIVLSPLGEAPSDGWWCVAFGRVITSLSDLLTQVRRGRAILVASHRSPVVRKIEATIYRFFPARSGDTYRLKQKT